MLLVLVTLASLKLYIFSGAVNIIYMQSIHNLESIDWTGYEQWVEDQWRSEEPIYVSQDMKRKIESTTSFSVKPIGPLREHVASEFFVRLMPESFANSYIVNSNEDASHLKDLFSVYKQPQPVILVYPFQTERYQCDNSLLSEALNKENPVITNLLIDHFGHHFVPGMYKLHLFATGISFNSCRWKHHEG